MMSVIETINDEYHFWHWLKQSGSYQDNFSVSGAKAVFNYFDELSDEMDKPIEFDPIAWCVEFSEYDSVAEAYKEHYGDDSDLPDEQKRLTREQQLEYFQDNTTVIELDNGHVIIGEF
jgi:hypothetical protein